MNPNDLNYFFGLTGLHKISSKVMRSAPHKDAMSIIGKFTGDDEDVVYFDFSNCSYGAPETIMGFYDSYGQYDKESDEIIFKMQDGIPREDISRAFKEFFVQHPVYSSSLLPQIDYWEEHQFVIRRHPNEGYYLHVKNGLEALAQLYSSIKCVFDVKKYSVFAELICLSADEMMMEQAYAASKRSKCCRKRVGCITTDSTKTNVVSIGYNGHVRGQENVCESCRPGLCGCVHAEVNAIIKDCGEVLYCTMLPCKSCAKLIVNAGVKQVYYSEDYPSNDSFGIFQNAGVAISRVLRAQYKCKLDILEKYSEA